MAQLRIDQVRKSFGKTDVLKGVDLDIADGEFIVLLGASGCGKSTLLRIIAGLEKQTSGHIMIGGEVVDHLPPARRGIAMVFQSYALYPHLDVAGNWALGLKQAGESRQVIEERTKEAARILALEQLLHRKPSRALGRAAAAGRDRPGDRPPAQGVPVRRAALQPRRRLALPGPLRDRPPAQAAGRHHGLRHPRPGRGDDAGRPDRGHGQGHRAAGRHARPSSTARPPTCSSPASSARPR